MNGWDVMSLLIVCVTVISCISIVAYGVWSVTTNETLIKHVHDLLKERNRDE